ncbi:T9SS type A sorting domain-containing protein [Aureivirga sp. CE67]|uniref:T9SS type A sorting domain-containing protein n=1 Tax=Aureivirga sp. CE67 TaxID=1788983 RepID=UPI0018C93B27|nr:T9SS type A sorting domain-containing protein [Aureivirga sp. CE67]
MTKKLHLLITLLLISFSNLYSQEYKEMIRKGTFTVQEIQDSAEKYFRENGTGKGSGYKQFKRWEFIALKKMDPDGYLKSDQFYFEELKKVNKIQNQKSTFATTVSSEYWTELGPTYYNQTSGWNPGVGRITSLAINPNNSNNILIGTPNAGVWRTTNKGNTWTPLTDHFSNLKVWSLAMDPSNTNTVYWGSTNGVIYKSTNQGTTWQTFADLSGSSVYKIAVHPTNSNIIYVAMNYGGFYRTLNGGQSWTKITSDYYGYDIEFNTSNPNIVYLSGKNFHKTTIDNSSTTTHNFSSGVKMIGVSAANSNKIYVLEEASGKFGALYVSNNGGTTFTTLNHGTKNYFGYSTTANDNRGQAPRDMDIAVSNTNANEVHIAGILTWRSTNGGVSFQITSDWVPANAAYKNIGYCHADVDILEFVDGELFVGSDGGLFVADNTSYISSNYYDDLTSGLGIREFYKLGISQTSQTKISGGSQDNGTSIYSEQTGQWKDWLGADGMETFFNINNSNIVYGTIYNGRLYRSYNGGNSYSSLPQGFTGPWVTAYEPDPVNSNTFYGGGKSLYKTTNGGQTWTSISTTRSSYINDIEISQTNNQIIYIGQGSRLYKTTNGGQAWQTVSGLYGQVRDIAIHPTNPNKVAVCINSSNQVYVSNDGGNSWSQYDKNLPNFSKTSIVWQNDSQNSLYVGMGYGVYMINDNLNNWVPFNNNLPNVMITELEINHVNNTLYTSTYGRGIWKTNLPSSSARLSNENQLTQNISIYPNPAKDKITISNQDESFNSSISIYDQNGRIVKYLKNIKLQENLDVDISNLENGIYFVKINTEKGAYTEKIIKK